MDEGKILEVLGRLEKGQAELQRGVAGLHERQITFGSSLAALQQQQHDFAVLTADRFARVEARVDRISDHVDRLSNHVDRLSNQVTEFRVVVMDRFERIEDKLTTMAADISVNMGAVEHANHRQDNDREELRSLTRLTYQVHSQVRRLQSEVDDLRKKAS